MAGGGSIGTIIEMGRYAVACAWTWLRFIAGPPTVAAFYCTVEDPRVAAIELERADGAVQRVDVVGKRAVVFPYAWDMPSKWPAQQPHAIRLFDTTGAPLALMTSLSAGDRNEAAPPPRIRGRDRAARYRGGDPGQFSAELPSVSFARCNGSRNRNPDAR